MINNQPAKQRPPEPASPPNSKPSAFPLWSLYDAILLCVLNAYAFAFFLGGEKYSLVAQMFTPVVIVATLGIIAQLALWMRRAKLEDFNLDARRALAQLNMLRPRAELRE